MKSFSQHAEEVKRRLAHFSWGDGDLEHHLAEDMASLQARLDSFPKARTGNTERYHELVSLPKEELVNQKRHMDSWFQSPLHQETHSAYKGNSGTFNSPLRKMANHTDDDITIHNPRLMPHLQSMDHIASSRTVKPFSLYRGFQGGLNEHEFHPGHEFTDHGYTGLSTLRNVSHSFGTYGRTAITGLTNDHRVERDDVNHPLRRSKVYARIHVPVGTMGHFLDHPDNPNMWGEGEFALHRGSRFRVTGHSRVETHVGALGPSYDHIVHMRVVGQHPKPLHAMKDEQ